MILERTDDSSGDAVGAPVGTIFLLIAPQEHCMINHTWNHFEV